jgi:hypothetical protein
MLITFDCWPNEWTTMFAGLCIRVQIILELKIPPRKSFAATHIPISVLPIIHQSWDIWCYQCESHHVYEELDQSLLTDMILISPEKSPKVSCICFVIHVRPLRALKSQRRLGKPYCKQRLPAVPREMLRGSRLGRSTSSAILPPFTFTMRFEQN